MLKLFRNVGTIWKSSKIFKRFKFLFYNMYKLHNSYFVYFVYFVYFWFGGFLYILYLYIYIYILYTRTVVLSHVILAQHTHYTRLHGPRRQIFCLHSGALVSAELWWARSITAGSVLLRPFPQGCPPAPERRERGWWYELPWLVR